MFVHAPNRVLTYRGLENNIPPIREFCRILTSIIYYLLPSIRQHARLGLRTQIRAKQSVQLGSPEYLSVSLDNHIVVKQIVDVSNMRGPNDRQ